MSSVQSECTLYLPEIYSLNALVMLSSETKKKKRNKYRDLFAFVGIQILIATVIRFSIVYYYT